MSNLNSIQNDIVLQDILQAHKRIQTYIYHTPLEFSEKFSSLYGMDIYLKMENLQITGSFKAWGAFNRILTLNDTERKCGVIASSAGNHGISLAYAAKMLNASAHVYLPNDADLSKIDSIERHGALIKYFDSIEDARLSALNASKEDGNIF